jgi:hypothetical protein
LQTKKTVTSKESAELQQLAMPPDLPELEADTQHAKDWHAIAAGAATESVNEHFRNEESRAVMWRQSRSIMFESTDGPATIVTEPVLSDLRFKYRSRVVGLGINVGACFFGIPVFGVPVEERTIGITVFVCGQDS